MYSLLFFTNVLRLLDEQEMTKYELAEKAGISVSFLSDLTNGKANPSLKIMEAIARALDAPLPALLETTDMDRETFTTLSGDKPSSPLPHGYVRVSAILTEYQAFTVQQWDEVNRQHVTQSKGK